MKVNFSKARFRKIGDKLRHGEALNADEEAMFSAFRVGHLPIMSDTYHLADNLMPNDVNVGARLKRRQTIVAKLTSRANQMDVTRMNDIAGCRLVFSSLTQLNQWRRKFASEMENRFDKRFPDDKYDYIRDPDFQTGYRGIHEVFQDRDENASVHALIEIQYRTIVQHSWATALEIWDNVNQHGAKFGADNPEVQRIFVLLSELLWRCFDKPSGFPENRPTNLPSGRLFREIAILEEKHHVLRTLRDVTEQKLEFHGPDAKNDFYVLRRFIPSSTGELEKKVVMSSVDPDYLDEYFKKEIVEEHADSMVFMSDEYKFSYPTYLNNAKMFLRNVVRALDEIRSSLGINLGSITLGQPNRFYAFLDDL